MERFATAIAASFTASGRGGWAWQIRARASAPPATSLTAGGGGDGGGCDVVVDVAGFSGDEFGEGDAFVFGLVGEHWTGDDVADGVDSGDVGFEVSVGDDAALGR